jgi:hypothetical protein
VGDKLGPLVLGLGCELGDTVGLEVLPVLVVVVAVDVIPVVVIVVAEVVVVVVVVNEALVGDAEGDEVGFPVIGTFVLPYCHQWKSDSLLGLEVLCLWWD